MGDLIEADFGKIGCVPCAASKDHETERGLAIMGLIVILADNRCTIEEVVDDLCEVHAHLLNRLRSQ